MNQEKIGKLIAKMRKQKDLTQRELGEMVGVGYRAVSKWETGQTMPDISIINELSEILGITSDELLNGELNPKDDNTDISPNDINPKPVKKNNKRLLFLLIISILIVIVIIGIIVVRNNNKPVEYTIQSLYPNDYQVDGTLTINGDDITININKIEFQDYIFSETIIKNYEYFVYYNQILLFGANGNYEYHNFNEELTVKDSVENLFINHRVKKSKVINKINKDKITIKFYFFNEDNSQIEKDVKLIILY